MKRLVGRAGSLMGLIAIILSMVGSGLIVPLLIEGFYYHNSTCIGWALASSLTLPISGVLAIMRGK